MKKIIFAFLFGVLMFSSGYLCRLWNEVNERKLSSDGTHFFGPWIRVEKRLSSDSLGPWMRVDTMVTSFSNGYRRNAITLLVDNIDKQNPLNKIELLEKQHRRDSMLLENKDKKIDMLSRQIDMLSRVINNR